MDDALSRGDVKFNLTRYMIDGRRPVNSHGRRRRPADTELLDDHERNTWELTARRRPARLITVDRQELGAAADEPICDDDDDVWIPRVDAHSTSTHRHLARH